ncbi:cysteine protease ATG4D-like [Pygocentrus nattereri]|uniref:Cysteine protease n=1 Tax=Pygocentrus nattereri TaxID=42514 RepID=A0A3B4CJS3_PYGNA|nr:cysteine protease ATG4D-like [Pygocentrus nattereri]
MSAGWSDDADPPDDLASFEVLSNPGPSDLNEYPQHMEAAQDKAKLKRRLMSAWNNVKYGGWSLKSKPHLSKTSPVCLLGHTYQLSSEGEREQFRRAFSSLLWMTYRKGFAPVGGSSLTSDSGWGCMLRTAQMLLAQGLLIHLMPEGWTWPGACHQTKDDLDVKAPQQSGRRSDLGKLWRRRSVGSTLDNVEDTEDSKHRHLVAWFGDTPSAPFSLHQLVELGKTSGKRAGDWYGPSIAAHILRKAVAASEVPNLAVYVAQDCTVYVGDVVRLCEEPQSQCNTSIIILVPVRLGGDTFNPAYVECVKKLLQLKCCIGIIGGKPKHSLYFVGFQDDKLLYLDPHLCQAAVDVSQANFPLESFHCKAARKMSFHRMDPSCTLGFYARNRKDFDSLRTEITTALTSSLETYPIFTFVEGNGQDEHEEEVFTSESVAHIVAKDKRKRSNKRSSVDDFVML